MHPPVSASPPLRLSPSPCPFYHSFFTDRNHPGHSPAQKPGFQPALPGWKYEFPRDHRVHREFKTEWWYYNGYLKGPGGQSFGYQVTFFRVGLIPGPLPPEGSRWRIQDVYLAHLAVSHISKNDFLFQEKAARGNLGMAGADAHQYRIWVENWKVIEAGKRTSYNRPGMRSFPFSLKIIPTGPPLIHGVNGVIQKGAGSGAGLSLLFDDPNGNQRDFKN